MKKNLKSILSLVCICAVMSVILAVTNFITTPIIEKNQEEAVQKALMQVMPQGNHFEKIDISSFSLPSTVIEAYIEESGGFVFKLNTSGYASNFIIMCGVNADGTVSGALCISSNETLGYEKTFGSSFIGKDTSSIDGVDMISSATRTTAAYRAAIKDALSAANTLMSDKGGVR